MAGILSDKQVEISASSRADGVAAGIRLTPKLRSVCSRTRAISASISEGDSRTMPRKPKPPALVTAATSSDRATPPIPASTTGYLQPSRSQTGVCSALVMTLWDPDVCHLPGQSSLGSTESLPAHLTKKCVKDAT